MATHISSYPSISPFCNDMIFLSIRFHNPHCAMKDPSSKISHRRSKFLIYNKHSSAHHIHAFRDPTQPNSLLQLLKLVSHSWVSRFTLVLQALSHFVRGGPPNTATPDQDPQLLHIDSSLEPVHPWTCLSIDAYHHFPSFCLHDKLPESCHRCFSYYTSSLTTLCLASFFSVKPKRHLSFCPPNPPFVAEWNSVEIPSRRGSSQWINGCVDNRSGFGEEDDNNTREVKGRELVLLFSVPWSARWNMTRGWMTYSGGRNSNMRLEPRNTCRLFCAMTVHVKNVACGRRLPRNSNFPQAKVSLN